MDSGSFRRSDLILFFWTQKSYCKQLSIFHTLLPFGNPVSMPTSFVLCQRRCQLFTWATIFHAAAQMNSWNVCPIKCKRCDSPEPTQHWPPKWEWERGRGGGRGWWGEIFTEFSENLLCLHFQWAFEILIAFGGRYRMLYYENLRIFNWNLTKKTYNSYINDSIIMKFAIYIHNNITHLHFK